MGDFGVLLKKLLRYVWVIFADIWMIWCNFVYFWLKATLIRYFLRYIWEILYLFTDIWMILLAFCLFIYQTTLFLYFFRYIWVIFNLLIDVCVILFIYTSKPRYFTTFYVNLSKFYIFLSMFGWFWYTFEDTFTSCLSNFTDIWMILV